MKNSALLFLFILFQVSHSNAQDNMNTRYKLVISFQSECCGVPSDTPIVKFIRSFRKNYKIKKISADEIGPMGKEGEYYLAFKLNELTRKQVKKFITAIKNVKKQPGDNGLFSFEENMLIRSESLPGRARISTLDF